MYSIYAKNFKCKVKTFDDKEFQFKLESLNKIISKKTKIIFLANPNNPTGSIFYKNELIKFLNKIKKTTLVVLDAAYCEYIKDHKYDDGMKLVKNYSNLIITRSFSKIFALGGLRIGWGYANSKIISQLYQYKKPFNVSRLSCIAAQESLKNKKWINESIKNNFINKTNVQNLQLQWVFESLSNADINKKWKQHIEINPVFVNGKLIVVEFYNTNVAGYYAIGDLLPTQALAHVASAEGIICVEKIAGENPEPIDYGNIPGCTYCNPEISSVGLTEAKAKEAGYEIRVGKFPFTASLSLIHI